MPDDKIKHKNIKEEWFLKKSNKHILSNIKDDEFYLKEMENKRSWSIIKFFFRPKVKIINIYWWNNTIK